MNIKIGRKTYTANTAMITLLRYRKEFGESFLPAFFDKSYNEKSPLLLVRLVWSAIEGDKPDFKEFLTAASECKNFGAAALSVQAGILMAGGNAAPNAQPSDSTTDEIDILALMAISGIGIDLIYELPAFLILGVISKRADIVGGGKPGNTAPKFRKMSDAEIKEAYRR